jgi:hypothetical protein
MNYEQSCLLSAVLGPEERPGEDKSGDAGAGPAKEVSMAVIECGGVFLAWRRQGEIERDEAGSINAA